MTRPGKIATKRFTMAKTGIETHVYDAGYLFGVLPLYKVCDIYGLSELLLALEGFSNLLVIRGVPRDAAHVGNWTQRTGDNTGAGNFATPAEGHHWIQIDFDKIKLPDAISLSLDSIGVAEHLVSLLPVEFHDASYHATLSSSAGMGDPSMVSMHIWFWLERQVTDTNLKIWAKSINEEAGFKLVDDTLFQNVQAHYTAAPVFDGVSDPFPNRSWCIKKQRHSVRPGVSSLLRRSAKPVGSKRSEELNTTKLATAVDANFGFESHLAAIGDHTGGRGFHGAIVSSAASYVGTHGRLGTNVEILYKLISARVLVANWKNHDRAYIEKMASRAHIVSAIDSAIRKFGDSDGNRGDGRRPRKTRRHEGVKPYFTTVKMTTAEAKRRLAELAAG